MLMNLPFLNNSKKNQLMKKSLIKLTSRTSILLMKKLILFLTESSMKSLTVQSKTCYTTKSKRILKMKR